MFPTLSTALSALTADQSAIGVTGNNLANLNTTGFKAGTVQFSDLMSQMIGVGAGTQVGMGVGQVQTSSIYTQGATTSTGAPLDAAIQGNGFFVVNSSATGTGTQSYTRAGNFIPSGNGLLVDAASGLPVTNVNGGSIAIPAGATNVSIGADGTVSATLPNGQPATLGRVALAAFQNPGGLLHTGGGYQASADSGNSSMAKASPRPSATRCRP